MAIETALDRDGSRVREIMTQYLAEVIEFVDTAATADGLDWAFLQECVDAYPPGVGDHHFSGVLANVVARCVIRTRIRDGVDAIPAWALEYLDAITMDADGDWAWESAVAVGWGVVHSQVDVLDRTRARAEAGDESWASGVLEHVTFADPDAGVELLERLLRSPDTVEDLVFLRAMVSPLDQPFPEFSQYWGPAGELDHEVKMSETVVDRLLAVLGETVHPERLRQFDDSFAFDLARAADEYGPADPD